MKQSYEADEPYEDDDYSDDNEQPPEALAGFDTSRVPFSREDLRNAEFLRTSDYRPIALEIIKTLPFTMEYKQALARWAQSKYNRDFILSDTTPKKIGRFSKSEPYIRMYLSAKLDLVKCRMSMSRSDKAEPAFNTIEDDLLFVFTSLLSRTYGIKRERLINSIMKTESEMIQRSGIIEQKNEEKKSKGWFGRK